MSDEIDNNDNLLVDLVKDILAASKRAIEVSIPCVVTKVISRTKVHVRPLIKVIDKDGNSYERDVIEGLPVFTNGAGDKFISFPIVEGDIGWIDASDRDISLFLQSYSSVNPPTNRMHDFGDARFVPDIMTNITIAEEDANAVVIQNRAGSVKIALDDNEIRVKNGSTVVTVSDGSVDAQTAGEFTFNGARITETGDVVTASGVSLDSHPHTQPNDSAGNSQQSTRAPTATE